MTASELCAQLDRERIVVLSSDVWREVAPAFELRERYATGVAGDLVILQIGGRPAAVEQPRDDARVVRRLDDAAAVRRFVAQRLEEYERMWDGCGCHIDYYA